MPPRLTRARRSRRASLAALLLAVLPGCDSSTPTNPTPACAFTLSSRSQAFSRDGGAGAVTVTTAAQCAWTVDGASGWVTLRSAASGTGTAAIDYTVAANTGEATREKVLTIGGVAFSVTQEGRAACTFAIAPEQKRFPDEGGTGTVTVTTAADCAWAATSDVNWITKVGGSDGRGPGTVEYRVAENNSLDARSGTLTVAGRRFTVEQDGEAAPPSPPADCRYAVAPVAFEPCMAATTITATVTTDATCAWTSTSGATWLSVTSGGSRAGTGPITIAVAENYEAPRSGVVMVRWATASQGQNIHVAQAGCHYAVSRDAISIPSAGGTGSFDVIQQSEPNMCGGPTQDRCVWTATSGVAWITITSSMPRAGDNPVAFRVAANTGTAARSGTIRVRDKVVTVAQAAP